MSVSQTMPFLSAELVHYYFSALRRLRIIQRKEKKRKKKKNQARKRHMETTEIPYIHISYKNSNLFRLTFFVNEYVLRLDVPV